MPPHLTAQDIRQELEAQGPELTQEQLKREFKRQEAMNLFAENLRLWGKNQLCPSTSCDPNISKEPLIFIGQTRVHLTTKIARWAVEAEQQGDDKFWVQLATEGQKYICEKG